MEHMNKGNRKCQTKQRRKWNLRVGMLGTVSVFAAATVVQLFQPVVADARDFDAEIKNLQKQVDSYNAQAAEKSQQANTLQGQIDALKSQQTAIQKQIDLSSAERSELEQKIKDNEAKLKEYAAALSENLKEQYYNGQTSTLDVLLNSDSVSDYVDRTVRQSAATDNIKRTVGEVNKIKSEQEVNKKSVEKKIAQNNSQKQDLVDNQNEQQQLLNQTRGDEAKFQEMSKQTEAQKAQVQKEQQAAIQAYIAEQKRRVAEEARKNSGGSNGSSSWRPDISISVGSKNGGYPFWNKPHDTYQNYKGFTANYNARECVNYVQWRIWQLTGTKGQTGHAYQWKTNMRTPQVNSVAVMRNIGSYGHVAWVEEIGSGSRAGMVRVSEYNWPPKGTNTWYVYNERWVSISSFSGFYKNW